jgi:hypothetical protein
VFRLALSAILLLFLVGACGPDGCLFTPYTNGESCSTHDDCVQMSDGEYDYCGQEGVDLCCQAGWYKCGCIDDLSCRNSLTCFACSSGACANGQPTICLDDVAGGAAGMTPIQ